MRKVILFRAGAAALDKRVAETAAAAGLGGLEFFFGIPGTVGGALRMNAGANGSETKDVLIDAVGVSRDGQKLRLTNAEMKFVYRNSGADRVDHLYLRALSREGRGAGSDPDADGRGAGPS